MESDKLICPACSFVDDSIPVPEYSKSYSVLGICKKCGKRIDIVPRQIKNEKSQDGFIQEGEKREILLTDLYMSKYGGNIHKKHDSWHLDRDIYENEKLKEVIEIKISTGSLNAYANTIFNYNKIEYGKEYMLKNRIPIFYVIKFCDCWTRHRLFVGSYYEKSKMPILPQYRKRYKKYQNANNRDYHYVVLLPIWKLEVLIGLGNMFTNYNFPEELISKS